jgi:excisionase family DNA binding protein
MPEKVIKRRLTSIEMAELLSVKPRTLRKWRYERVIPFEQVGFVILFDPDAVITALKKYERKPAAVKGRKSVTA